MNKDKTNIAINFPDEATRCKLVAILKRYGEAIYVNSALLHKSNIGRAVYSLKYEDWRSNPYSPYPLVDLDTLESILAAQISTPIYEVW